MTRGADRVTRALARLNASFCIEAALLGCKGEGRPPAEPFLVEVDGLGVGARGMAVTLLVKGSEGVSKVGHWNSSAEFVRVVDPLVSVMSSLRRAVDFDAAVHRAEAGKADRAPGGKYDVTPRDDIDPDSEEGKRRSVAWTAGERHRALYGRSEWGPTDWTMARIAYQSWPYDAVTTGAMEGGQQ